jgi:subfamily B ATP-binding cassette protein MsbA
MIDAPVEDDPGTRELGRARGHLRFETCRSAIANATAGAGRVTLDVPPGQTVALVGMSGGGKSTFVNLVTRFYAPTAGRILLDGVPYEDITLASLRAQLAMVSQNVVLFDDTLARQHRLRRRTGRLRAPGAASGRAPGRRGGAPAGRRGHMIGENGMRLSGGQRQRVAIARAIYKDAPILILDEATSALDNESERAVQAALDTADAPAAPRW